MAKHSKKLQEVENVLRKTTEQAPRYNIEQRRNIYRTELDVFGLSVPEQRAVAKKGFSFCTEPPQKLLEIWDFVWHQSQIFEVKNQAVLYYENRAKKLGITEHWPTLKGWTEKGLDNWEHSDRLSKIYSFFSKQDLSTVYPTLKDWNISENPWARRQSVLGLMCYSSMHETHPPHKKIFPLVKKLLEDKEYYVQKAVGWTLREAGNVYPMETLNFLQSHLGKISPTAFTISVEKLNPEIKQQLKDTRKQLRKK